MILPQTEAKRAFRKFCTVLQTQSTYDMIDVLTFTGDILLRSHIDKADKWKTIKMQMEMN